MPAPGYGSEDAIRRPAPIRGCAGVLLAVLVIFFASSDASRSAGLRSGDLLDYFIPQAEWVGRALGAGRLPLWNEQVGCGLDQFVTLQTAVLYPPTWVHAFLPVPLGLAVLAVLHLVLAGGGLYAWLHELGVRTGPALLAVAALTFGLIADSWWPPALYTVAWTPLVFYLIDRPGPWSAKRWCALAGCFAVQLLAGYPMYFVCSAALAFPYLVIKTLRQRGGCHGQVRDLPVPVCVAEESHGQTPTSSGPAHGTRPLACAVTALVAGGAIAGVQLVPSYRYLATESCRAERLPPAQVHYITGGVPQERKPSQIHRIVRNGLDNTQKVRALGYRFSYGYLGLFVPFAVCVCLLCKPGWRTAYFLLAAAAGLYLCTGFSPGWLPVYEWLSRLPVFGSFRTPDRLLVWLLFGASALTAFGAERIWPGPSQRRRPLRVAAVALGVAAMAVIGGCRAERGVLSIAMWLLAGAWLLIGAVGSAGLWRVNRVWSSRFGSAFGVGVALALTLADLWRASGFVCPYIHFPSQHFDRVHAGASTLLTHGQLESLAEHVGPDRMHVAGPHHPVMRTAALPALRSLPFLEPLMPRRHFELDRALHPDEPAGCRHFTLWDIPPAPHRRLFDWCSVRVLATEDPISDAEQLGWRELAILPNGTRVYENRRVVPRASLWTDYRVVPADVALARLVSPMQPGEKPPLLLERHPAEAWLARRAQPDVPAGSEAGSVEFRSDEPEYVALDVRCAAPALLLLTDSYAEGWRCSVDGAPAQMLRANYLHRAVALLRGKHLVEFRYRPPGLEAGALVSLTGLLTLGAVFACGARSRRAGGARPLHASRD